MDKISEEPNEAYKELVEHLTSCFPDVGEKVFRILIQARLTGCKINENHSNLSHKTAEEFKKSIGGLSESNLREWLWGLLEQEEGRYYKMFKDVDLFPRIIDDRSKKTK